MTYPALVPLGVCRTPIKVYITRGLTEGGAPAEKLTFDGKCCYSEKTRQALDAERRLVTLTGAAYFSGDLAPDLETLQGYALVNGGSVKRLIHYAERGRNPDGTVNFTRLDLM